MIWRPYVTVATVVERDSRFLMVEEYADGELVYNQPAGHLDEHESLAAAALRETFEETGWEVGLTALIGVYQWRHPASGKTFLRFCFAAEGRRHHPDQPLDEGIQQALWFSRAELSARESQLRSPMVLRCVDDYLAGRRYPLALLARL